MDFHGMKRKDLQALCKKHGIPANLKNIEMASRLASVFEETEETFTDTISLSEDSVDVDVLKDDLVVKKVRFSPENEVFEFTRSVKRCQRKNVRTRCKGNVQDLQESGTELRRSTRNVAKGKTVAGSNENESNTRRGHWYDVTKALKAPRRSKRIGSCGSTQEDCKGTELMALEQFEFEDISEGLSGNSQDGFELEKIGRRSTQLTSKAGTSLLVDIEDKEDELVKNNVKEVVSMDFEVQETGKRHRKDVQDDPKFEKVPRPSRRIVNDIDVQANTIEDQRRSTRLKARAANPSMGGESSDRRLLCSVKESKEEIKTTKQSKGSTVVNSQEGELVKNKTKEPSIDCEVQTTEDYRRMKVHDASTVEKVPRRSKRRCNDINVLMDKRPVKAVKRDDLGVKKAPKQSRQREKSLSELLVDGQAQKGDKQPKRTFGNGREDKKLLRSSTHTTLDNTLGQAMRTSPKRFSAIDCERDGAFVDNVKKSNVNDEMQVHVRFTRNSSRHDSFEAPIVVEGNLVEKKTEESLEKKRDRSTQSNQTPRKLLDQYAQFEQEEAGAANVESRGSSKRSKAMNHKCVKDKPQGMIENSPSSSDAKAGESVMITENVLDSTPEKAVDSSQRTNTQELNSELKEDKSEKRLERDTVLIAAIKENKKEVSSCSVHLSERLSPASVQYSVSNSKAELVVPTGHIFVKDSASTVVEENINTKEEILICTISELKEHISVEAILENSAECWKEIHPSKDEEKSSLEKEVQAANIHGNFFEYNTENNSAEEEKAGCLSAGHCVNLTPEKLLDEYAQLDPEEAGGPKVEAIGSSKTMKTVNQECVKDKQQGIENSPSTSETKAAELVMISENVLESTLKRSVDISPRGNTQELHSELMEGDCEEKHEQDTVLMAEIKEKEESSSLSLFLIERSEVSNPEVELFVETTPPPTSVLLAVSNPEAELGDPTAHILVKDIASTVIAKEDIKTKKEILISTPTFELKEHSFVAKLGEAEAILENSSECRNEIQSSKDGETGSLKKTIQAENLHGNFSGYNTENSKVACISFGDCVNLEMLDKVKDEILEKSEQRSSFERGCKLKALELRRCSSTDFTSHSLKENNVSKCFEEDKTKALSLPLPGNNDSSAFDELAIFTSPERKLMLMEQISEKGKTLAADSVTQHNDEAVESHAVVFTTPKQVSTLGDAGIDEAGKEEEHTATDFPDEFDVINTTERYLMLGGSKQTEARNEGESIVVELHDESDIATISERKFTVGDFKGDRFGMNEENRTVELQRESGTCTSLDTHTLLGNYISGGGNKPMEFYEESVVFTDPERYELFGSFGQDKARESEGKKVVQLYEKSEVSTGLHSDQPLANSELSEAGWQGINSADKSGLFTSVERQLLYGGSEQKEAVKTGEKAGAEFHDGYAVPNIPVRHPFPENSELDEAAKGEENKPVELRVDSGIFTSAEKHLETDEGVRGDNITAKSHVVSDVLTAAEGQFLMGESEPDEAEKKCRENKDVELLGESNTSSNPERYMLFGDSELDGTKNIRDYTATTCEESFVFTSPERRQLLVNFKPYSAGNQEQKEVNDSVVQGSLVAAPDFKENIIADSSGSIASKVSHSHDCNAGKETAGAELMPKGSPAEDAVGLDTTQGASKKSREHFPHVDSLNLFDFDTEAETIMEAERNVSFSSYVTLPAKGNSETIDEISRYLEVAGTCSMVSEEPGPSTDIQNQVHDPLEGLAITTDNNEADELIETKLTKNIQKGFEGNFLLNSSGGSYVSGKTCILAGTENEDKAASPIATAFEKTISLTPDEFTVQNNMNEKDKEMIRREATPETRKEYLKIDESGPLSEMQVRREPSLIYRTQVKPKRHDMKENAPNSKIVHNLNVTAPRTSKRRPLQDLRKN